MLLLIFVFFNLSVSVSHATSVGISPSAITFRGLAEKQLIIHNPNPFRVKIRYDPIDQVDISMDSQLIEPYSSARALVKPKGHGGAGYIRFYILDNNTVSAGLLVPVAFNLSQKVKNSLNSYGIIRYQIEDEKNEDYTGIIIMLAIPVIGSLIFMIIRKPISSL